MASSGVQPWPTLASMSCTSHSAPASPAKPHTHTRTVSSMTQNQADAMQHVWETLLVGKAPCDEPPCTSWAASLSTAASSEPQPAWQLLTVWSSVTRR
jgi:hypothetical protein